MRIPLSKNIDQQNIKEISEMFKNAQRYGDAEDTPEGARYIKFSDTLANRLGAFLSDIASRMEA